MKGYPLLGLFLLGFTLTSLEAFTCPSTILVSSFGLRYATPTLFLANDSPTNVRFSVDSNWNETVKAERMIRRLKAKARIDEILNDPLDPPIDMEEHLRKVTRISLPLSEDSNEGQVEAKVNQLEGELYEAIRTHDFKTAHHRSSELSKFHLDDCGRVLQANARYYQAFSRKDLDDMRRVWLADVSCICIHPSRKPEVGIDTILDSWQTMFQQNSGQKTWIDVSDIHMTVKATMAIVTCKESIYGRRFILGQQREDELLNQLQATNIFRKVGERWYMTYHHSSWHANSRVGKRALERQDPFEGAEDSRALPIPLPMPDAENSDFDPDEHDVHIFRLDGSPPDSAKPDTPEAPQIPGLAKALGLPEEFGPLSGGESSLPKPPSSDSNQHPRMKRIPMGSLPDFLAGPLASLFGGGEAKDENNHSDTPELPDGVRVFFRDNVGGASELKFPGHHGPGRSEKTSNHNQVRQACVATIRSLAKEGRLSTKQKRRLLQDIVRCSARSETSVVEVAYDLLVASYGGSNIEDAQEDFADQCLVLAEQLLDDD